MELHWDEIREKREKKIKKEILKVYRNSNYNTTSAIRKILMWTSWSRGQVTFNEVDNISKNKKSGLIES